MAHRCNRMGNGREWLICVACEGRMHAAGCTSRRNPAKDCCEARHVELHNNGCIWGLLDTAVPMLGTHSP